MKQQDKFTHELSRIESIIRQVPQSEQAKHFLKIVWVGNISLIIGYSLAWQNINLIAIVLISLASFIRWTIVAHHVLHGGYDEISGLSSHFHSKRFAQGWKRWIHWCDWLDPQSWILEHNYLHHYCLGEIRDPDVVEDNVAWLRELGFPAFFNSIIFFLANLCWKFIYYAPRLALARNHKADPRKRAFRPLCWKLWNPFEQPGKDLWKHSWVPYIAIRFLIVPSCFLWLGAHAWFSVLINSILAELLTNIHSFAVIVTNHSGADVARFDSLAHSKEERIKRAIIGSVNFRCGGQLNDLLHGYLNYQIEHHIWPDMSARQYQLAQPMVKQLCKKNGIPYNQQSIWVRYRKLFLNAIGKTSMQRRLNAIAPSAR